MVVQRGDDVPAHGRGRLFAAVHVVCYLAFSIPALVGGLATDVYGLGTTTTGYTLFDLLMVLFAAIRPRPRSPAADSPVVPRYWSPMGVCGNAADDP